MSHEEKVIIAVKLTHVLPNPCRDLERLPLSEDKIVRLAEIFKRDSVVITLPARRERNEDGEPTGRFEIAFGHHRVEAMRRNGLDEVLLGIQDYTDAQMLRLMHDDNSEEFDHSSALEAIQLVRGAVALLAAGKLPEAIATENTRVDKFRYAPHFTLGCNNEARDRSKPYTATSLAKALDCTKKNGGANITVQAGLLALELEEKHGVAIFEKKNGKMIYNLKASNATSLLNDCKHLMELYDHKAEQHRDEVQREAEADQEQRRLQAERKATEQSTMDARQQQVKVLVDARMPELIRQAEETKARLKAKSAAEDEKDVLIKEQSSELNRKIEERRKAEAATKKGDAYLPIKREVERILQKLEGVTATTKEALSEEIKALSRLPLNSTDRERLRQAALTYAGWLTEWAAVQFLPPFSAQRKLNEYRNREAAAHRVAALAAGRRS